MKNNVLNVETPIGRLIFELNMARGEISELHISQCDIEPKIPKGMSVEGCKAILLRCTSKTHLKDLTFSCSWMELEEKGFSNSGECLDAWEWEHKNTLVLIGTEDDECLGSRVDLKKSTSDYYPITMKDNTIKIHISEFPKSKVLTLHYMISWNFIPEKIDSSCWFAVDVPHNKVLEICN